MTKTLRAKARAFVVWRETHRGASIKEMAELTGLTRGGVHSILKNHKWGHREQTHDDRVEAITHAHSIPERTPVDVLMRDDVTPQLRGGA